MPLASPFRSHVKGTLEHRPEAEGIRGEGQTQRKPFPARGVLGGLRKAKGNRSAWPADRLPVVWGLLTATRRRVTGGGEAGEGSCPAL